MPTLSKPRIAAAAAAALLISAILFLALGGAPDTPPIPGGVARLEQWELSSSRQWVVIRGQNPKLPLLLVVAGGPGGSELASYRKYQAELERAFIVVHWEQAGAGKSYDAFNPDSGLDPALADLKSLATRLKSDFPDRPLHLVGHSWGSLVALLSAAREPRLYSTVTAVSPLISPRENSRRLYSRVLKHAKGLKDDSVAERLTSWGPPPHSSPDWVRRHAFLVDQERDYFSPRGLSRVSAWDLLSLPEYSLFDVVHYFQGLFRTFESVWPKVLEVDLRRDATQVVVPVFFFLGAHDFNVDPDLAREYARILRAPRKEIVNFAASAHSPHIHEPDLFRRTLYKRVTNH